MENQHYKKQVALLLNVLPEVAKESCFVLHGGTAINLLFCYRGLFAVAHDPQKVKLLIKSQIAIAILGFFYFAIEDYSLSLMILKSVSCSLKAKLLSQFLGFFYLSAYAQLRWQRLQIKKA